MLVNVDDSVYAKAAEYVNKNKLEFPSYSNFISRMVKAKLIEFGVDFDKQVEQTKQQEEKESTQ